jgi:methyl-accepting chemotaxis protein
MEAATFARPGGSRRATGSPPHPTFVRWLWLWITTLVLVVIVVIGFLLGIVSNLKSINDGLFSANASVASVRGQANPLPMFIGEINGNLTKINTALLPIPHQGVQILTSLTAIHGSLGQVESSLVDTTNSLVNTSGSLVNTSNSLVTSSNTLGQISSALVTVANTLTGVSGSLTNTSGKLVTISNSLANVTSTASTINHRAGEINTTLIAAQGASDGTTKINAQLQALLGAPTGLDAVNTDAGNIETGLQEANAHLNSICNAKVLNTIPIPLPGLIAPSGCPAK